MEKNADFKNYVGISGLAFLPKQHLHKILLQKSIHIIGMGEDGINAMKFFEKKGIGHVFTAIKDLSNHLPNQKEKNSIYEAYNRNDRITFNIPTSIKMTIHETSQFLLLARLQNFTEVQNFISLINFLNINNTDFKVIYSIPLLNDSLDIEKLMADTLIYNEKNIAYFKFKMHPKAMETILDKLFYDAVQENHHTMMMEKFNKLTQMIK
ncbi:hypothetical protein [Anditalea andensis]|nr:hypothetical protein [Anditalea andensis]